MKGWLALTGLAVCLAACSSASDADPTKSDGKTNPDGTPVTDPSSPTGSTDPTTPGGPTGSGPSAIDGVCPALTMPTSAATIYVDAASTAESGTKEAPYKTIAKALQNAQTSGIIWVAAGTYAENLSVPNKDVQVLGGFASGFASRTDACATIIQAASASKPVFDASSEVKSFGLEGVTVTKGSRGLAVDGDESVKAVYTITSSVFSENGNDSNVGGAVSLDRTSGKISRSVFKNNRAAKGAAISCGGETVAVTIESNLFEKNIGAQDHGGAVYLTPKTGTVTRNTFRGNEIGRGAGYGYGWGGAVIVFKAGAAAVHTDFSYNIFTDNLASIGGAVFVDDGAIVTMSHDLFYKNRGYPENGVVKGAAIYVDGDGLSAAGGSTFTADHLTIVDNVYDTNGKASTAVRGGDVYVERNSKVSFKNTIFWANGEQALWSDGTGNISVSYSIAPAQCANGGTCSIGTGVSQPTAVDFVDQAAADFHDKSTAGHFHAGAWVNDNVTSASVDKADPGEAASTEPAPNGNRTNLGVYGGTAEASKSP